MWIVVLCLEEEYEGRSGVYGRWLVVFRLLTCVGRGNDGSGQGSIRGLGLGLVSGCRWLHVCRWLRDSKTRLGLGGVQLQRWRGWAGEVGWGWWRKKWEEVRVMGI